MSEERIPVPQSFLNAQEVAQARRECVDQWRGFLSEAQRKALDTDPFGRFVSKIPMDVITGRRFTHEELLMLQAHEQAEYDQHKPIAQDKAAKLRAWKAAGGDEASFEEEWQMFGEREAIDRRAAQLEARARASSPY